MKRFSNFFYLHSTRRRNESVKAIKSKSGSARFQLIDAGSHRVLLPRNPQKAARRATRKNLREFYKMAIPAKPIARAVAYAIEQPADVEIDEVVVRPTARASSAEVNYAPFLLVPLAPILAGFSYSTGVLYDARNISTACPRPGKGMYLETLDFLSHDTGGWSLRLLQRGRAQRRANAFAVARASFLIPNVRAPVLSAFRSLPPCRAGLPRLRTQ